MGAFPVLFRRSRHGSATLRALQFLLRLILVDPSNNRVSVGVFQKRPPVPKWQFDVPKGQLPDVFHFLP